MAFRRSSPSNTSSERRIRCSWCGRVVDGHHGVAGASADKLFICWDCVDLLIEMRGSGQGAMPIVGGLIAESLRVGAVLEGVPLRVTKVSRADVGDVDAGQPRTWTFFDFEASDEDTLRLADALEGVLAAQGGWYCDFRSDTETFLVFADRTFRYPRGDEQGRSDATAYARSVGVPEAQLDWPV